MAGESLRAGRDYPCPFCGVQKGMRCVVRSRKDGPNVTTDEPHSERVAAAARNEPGPSGIDEQRALVVAIAEYRCVGMCREDDKPCRECERLAEAVVACSTDVFRNEIAAAIRALKGGEA